MKVFIVLAAFFAAASASAIGYSAHGLGLGSPLVSGIGSINTIGASYVSPIATRIVSPGLVSSIGVSHIQPVATRLVSTVPVATRLVSSPVLTSVRTLTPIVSSVHLSPIATRVVSPVAALNVHSSPILSNVVGPSLYASHGSGLYASGYLAKKL